MVLYFFLFQPENQIKLTADILETSIDRINKNIALSFFGLKRIEDVDKLYPFSHLWQQMNVCFVYFNFLIKGDERQN